MALNLGTGRGSWIRTNDLQYPKLPRYQAALYPECPASPVDTRFPWRQQASKAASKTGNRPGLPALFTAEQRVADAITGADAVLLRRSRHHLQHGPGGPPGRDDFRR